MTQPPSLLARLVLSSLPDNETADRILAHARERGGNLEFKVLIGGEELGFDKFNELLTRGFERAAESQAEIIAQRFLHEAAEELDRLSVSVKSHMSEADWLPQMNYANRERKPSRKEDDT